MAEEIYNEIFEYKFKQDTVLPENDPVVIANFTIPWKSGHSLPYILSIEVLDGEKEVIRVVDGEIFAASISKISTDGSSDQVLNLLTKSNIRI